jgi:hypothetical protein
MRRTGRYRDFSTSPHYTLYADEPLALLTSASFAFSVHALLTTSFRSLRAITGVAKHGVQEIPILLAALAALLFADDAAHYSVADL